MLTIDEDGDVVLRVGGTGICAHGSTEREAWKNLLEAVALVVEDLEDKDGK